MNSISDSVKVVPKALVTGGKRSWNCLPCKYAFLSTAVNFGRNSSSSLMSPCSSSNSPGILKLEPREMEPSPLKKVKYIVRVNNTTKSIPSPMVKVRNSGRSKSKSRSSPPLMNEVTL
ncbi:hypothetical protein WICPIJ_000683 [Wickerhamomyces pijperi]|uniref:Uncharacterized protein n=1 Tax=Wickerhamomyces pijperi TaxID=599730 RepID=A0A9P8QFW6_WICPI|nr:hypothetical protein WICPIJ_000683 [Wickerhamomyces pijperi]